MSALTAVQTANIQGGVRDIASRPVLADTKIWKGGMVGVTAAGYARPFQTGDYFGGHALETVDNTGGASADLRVQTLRGFYTLTVATFDSTTIAHLGDSVSAASDNHADMTRDDGDYVGTISDVNDNGVQVSFRTFEINGITGAVQDALDLKADS
jgi:hypothetical protein